ncbi:MAG: hypothetical protein HY700_13755 [Gemmatimonadetes bacterium]|nr:hypothetical protein [Gemmatimonadota bacterium]
MAQELGGSQIGALLETVPGIASVLRSPVADALVNMIRAGAGLGEFRVEDTRELIQYAVRRGLIGSEEGERLTADIEEATRRRAKAGIKAAPKAERQARPKALHKPAKRAAAKKSKAGKKRRA